jgi:hypothetical protein
MFEKALVYVGDSEFGVVEDEKKHFGFPQTSDPLEVGSNCCRPGTCFNSATLGRLVFDCNRFQGNDLSLCEQMWEGGSEVIDGTRETFVARTTGASELELLKNVYLPHCDRDS